MLTKNVQIRLHESARSSGASLFAYAIRAFSHIMNHTEVKMTMLEKGPLAEAFIMKTCLFKYSENFTTKNWKFSDKILIFFTFLLKT